MSVEELSKRFDSEQACIAYLERMRWPEGVRCLKCDSDGISQFQTRGKTGKARYLYQCVACRYQFSVTTGTIFHDSHIPLKKWFLAIAILEESDESKKRLSTNQLARALGVQYKSACRLVDCIREVLEGKKEQNPGATTEENVSKTREEHGQQTRPLWEKRAFLDLTGGARHGKAAALPIPDKSPRKARRRETVTPTALESKRGKVAIRATPKFWSLFKRGLTASFAIASVPVVSAKNLPGFLNDLTHVVGSSFLSALPPGIPRPPAKRKD